MAQAESDKSDLKGTKSQHLNEDQEQNSEAKVADYESSKSSCEFILKSEKEADNEVKKVCDTNYNKTSSSIIHKHQENSRPNKLSLLNPFRPEFIPPLSVSPCSPSIKSRNSCIGSTVSDSPSPVSSHSLNWSSNSNTTSLCPYSSFNCSTGILIASPTRQSLVDLEAIKMRLSGQNQLKSLSPSKLCCKEKGCDESECRQAAAADDWHFVDQEVEHDGDQISATSSSLLYCARSHRLQPIQICRQHVSSDQTTTSESLQMVDKSDDNSNSSKQGKDSCDNSRKARASLLSVQQTIPRTFSTSVLASGVAAIQRRQSGGNSRCLPINACSGTNNSINSSSTATSNSQQRFSFWDSLVGSSNLEKHRSKSQYLHQISCLDYNNQNKRSQNLAISDTSHTATTNSALPRDEFQNQQQQQQENFTQNQQQAQFLQLPTFWTQQTRKR